MILIDHRKDYALLAHHFKPYGIQIVKAGGENSTYPELEYGDIVFSGHGADGIAHIACERKALSDLVSSIDSRRLSGSQLIGLLDSYDYIYLVVEGEWRAGEAGELEVRKSVKGKWGWYGLEARGRRGRNGSTPTMLYREVSNYLQTLTLKCGVNVVRTRDHRETAAWAAGTYRWFQKEWDKHTSHEEIYAPIVSPQREMKHKPVMRRAGAVEMIASQLPNVDRKAWEFGKTFKSPYALANASVEELMLVDGIGRKGAEKIWKWWRGLS